MSTVTTRTEQPAASRRRPASTMSGLSYLTGFHAVVASWFWPFPILGIVIATYFVQRFGEVETSIWENAAFAPRWFLFSMGIAVVATMMATWVAHGRTRRSLALAALGSMVVAAAGYAAVYALGHLVEHWVFTAQGWPSTTDRAHLYSAGNEVGPVLLESFLVFLSHGLSGLLVVAAYYRGGGFLGTIALPLTLLPIAVAEVAMYLGWDGATVLAWMPIEAVGLGAPVVTALVLAGCALASLAVVGLLRGVALTDPPS